MLSGLAQRHVLAATAAGAGALLAATLYAGRDPAASANKIKVVYFNAPGRALATRAALGAAGVAYEDVRVDAKGLEMRRGPTGYNKDVPLGQLPVIELPDGSVHAQSASIARWAGKKAGLYPKNDDEALVVDEVCETLAEMGSKIPDDKNPDTKKQLREKWVAEVVPRYLEHVSRLIEARGGPHVLGKTFSLADIAVYGTCSRVRSGALDFVPKDLVDKYPTVARCADAAAAHSVIKKELERKVV